MKHKKLLALLFCVLVLCGLLFTQASAANDPYFIAVNDEFPLLTQQTEPIRVGGVTYVPCTIFDSRVTGTDLGVSYRFSAETEKVSLYSRSRTLEFDIKTGMAYSYDEEKEYSYQAVLRNGMPYVPAVSACNYFSLSCTFPVTDDAQYQILRIKDGTQLLNDGLFMRSARPHLDERMAQYNQGGKDTNKPSNDNKPGSNPTQPEMPEDNEPIKSLYLGIRVNSATELSASFAALSAYPQMKAVFFFEPARLASCDELLREIVGRGHRVGLILDGEVEAAKAGLEEGNQMLSYILRQPAAFAISNEPSEELQKALREQGCILWIAHTGFSGAGKSDSANYQAMVNYMSGRSGRTRLLLDDAIKGGTLSSVLRKLSEENCEMRALRETDY